MGWTLHKEYSTNNTPGWRKKDRIEGAIRQTLSDTRILDASIQTNYAFVLFRNEFSYENHIAMINIIDTPDGILLKLNQPCYHDGQVEREATNCPLRIALKAEKEFYKPLVQAIKLNNANKRAAKTTKN